MALQPGPFEASGLPYSHSIEPPATSPVEPTVSVDDREPPRDDAATRPGAPEFPGIVAAGPDRPVPHAAVFYTLALPPTPDARVSPTVAVQWRVVAIAAAVATALALAAVGAAWLYAHHAATTFAAIAATA